MGILQSIFVWILEQFQWLLQKVIDIVKGALQYLQDSFWSSMQGVLGWLEPIQDKFLELLPLLREIGIGIFALKLMMIGVVLLKPGSLFFQGGEKGVKKYWKKILFDVKWMLWIFAGLFAIWLLS